MKQIEGRARSIREILDNARYTIDFYQREYAWKERQERWTRKFGQRLKWIDSFNLGIMAQAFGENYGKTQTT